MIQKKEENGEKYATATTEAEFHEALNRGLAVELTRELAEPASISSETEWARPGPRAASDFALRAFCELGNPPRRQGLVAPVSSPSLAAAANVGAHWLKEVFGWLTTVGSLGVCPSINIWIYI